MIKLAIISSAHIKIAAIVFYAGAPDIWDTLRGWLNKIQNNESPAALPMPFDDGKTETLPPVPGGYRSRNRSSSSSHRQRFRIQR